MTELFRKQVVDHAARRLEGEVVLASPFSLKILSGFIFAALAAAMIFACSATYARKETVVGGLVPRGGLIRVTSRSAGTLVSLGVNEGQRVGAAARIAVVRLSTDVTAGDVSVALQRGLAAEATAARAQAQASIAKLLVQQREMTLRQRTLQQERVEIQSRVPQMELRQKIAEEQLERGEKLAAKGFYTASRLSDLRSAALVAAQDASQARSSVLDLEQQVGTLQASIAAVPTDIANIRAQMNSSLAALAQRQTTDESQASLVVTAPLDGTVVALPIQPGQPVAQGGTIAVITPNASEMMAELYVPSRSAGMMKVGDDVRLMYQAFPYQTFGTGKGRIAEISRTLLAPSEVALPGLNVQEPVLRVRVALSSKSVSAYGRVIELKPGMLLSADLISDRRTFIQWILDPLYAAGRRV